MTLRVVFAKRLSETNVLNVPMEWKTFYIPMKSLASTIPKGSLIFGGHKSQSLEISEFKIIDFRSKPLAELPRTKVTYKGMKPDAPWRIKAAERIERFRKSNITLLVTDSFGKPIQNANIHLELTNLKFGHGVTLPVTSYDKRRSSKEKQEIGRELVLDNEFNKIVLPNALKWRHYKPNAVDFILDWAKKHHLPVRGHALIWGKFKRADYNVEKKKEYYIEHPEEFRKLLIQHIKEFTSKYKGRLAEWDVVNEPVPENEYTNILGKEEMVNWFKTARKYAPNCTLFINDYSIIAGGDIQHREMYHDYIKFLVKNNTPLDGIGFQSHFAEPIAPEEIYKRLQYFEEFNKIFQATEFTFKNFDKKLVALFTKDFLTIIYSHPKAIGVVKWKAIDEPTNLNPMMSAWNYMFKNVWNTNKKIKTNNKGIVATRAFKGEYKVVVEANGKKKIINLNLDKDSSFKIKL
jgi:GH35 family endo-1,4-beta-xylanase